MQNMKQSPGCLDDVAPPVLSFNKFYSFMTLSQKFPDSRLVESLNRGETNENLSRYEQSEAEELSSIRLLHSSVLRRNNLRPFPNCRISTSFMRHALL